MFGIFDYTKPIVDFQNFDISQLGNAFLFGGAILLVGMLTVFAVLALLWLFLHLFKVFLHDLPAKRPAKKNLAQAPVIKETAEHTSKRDDGEIIAVIAAAIAAAESENSGMKFRVVSFRKV